MWWWSICVCCCYWRLTEKFKQQCWVCTFHKSKCLLQRMQFSAYIDGLVQERRNSIANALELHLSCTNPSIQWWGYDIKTFSALLDLYDKNQGLSDSPHKGPVMWSCHMFSLLWAWRSCWTNSQVVHELRWHNSHVMVTCVFDPHHTQGTTTEKKIYTFIYIGPEHGNHCAWRYPSVLQCSAISRQNVADKLDILQKKFALIILNDISQIRHYLSSE